MPVFINYKKRLSRFTLAVLALLIVRDPTILMAVAGAKVAETSAETSVNVLPSNSRARNNLNKAGQSRARESYGRLPIRFEANRGQSDPRVDFIARASGHNIYLTATGAVMALRIADSGTRNAKSPKAIYGPPDSQSAIMSERLAVLRMQIVGASPASVGGVDELASKCNYFTGDDPARWRANVPTYSKVRYENVYPGIDLLYYGNRRQLEYDFKLAPGANFRKIRLRYEGALRVRVDRNGDLVIDTAAGEVRQLKPVAYQIINGVKRTVGAGYSLRGKREAGFEIAAYDKSRPLVIDPVLTYSTYLGGGSSDEGAAIAVDSSGNAYVMGRTLSGNFPTTPGVIQSLPNGVLFDAFVAKLNPTGTALIYSTYLGGSDANAFISLGDQGTAIAVDSSGAAYVAGYTTSPNFPTTPGVVQRTVAVSGTHAFIAKLNPTGSALAYATYLGGNSTTSSAVFGQSAISAIALDGENNVYVTGRTDTVDFPTVGAVQANLGGGGSSFSGGDAFVTKLNATGTALIYSTYLGGNGDDAGADIAVDQSGAAYVTGSTRSTNLATTEGAFQKKANGLSPDSFVAKLDASGASVVYLTYLGGSFEDSATSIAVDSSGAAYVTGSTFSIDFPTVNPIQGVNNTGPAFKSTDGGATWKVVNTGLNARATVSLAVDPKATSTVYAGTDAGVFKTTDGGESWGRFSEGLTGFDVLALAVDPQTTTTVYAGTENGGIFKSTDGGATWAMKTLMSGRLVSRLVFQVIINPLTPSTIYVRGSVVEEPPGGPSFSRELFKSTDAGETWTALGVPTQFGLSALAIDPKTPATLYLGTAADGVFKSTNGGATWSATGLDIEAFSLLVDPINTANVYASTFDRKSRLFIYKSTNGGTSWARTEGMGTLLALDPVNPATLYAKPPSELGEPPSRITKTTDGGATFKPISLRETPVRAIVINPSNPQTLYAGTNGGADAFVAKLNAEGTALVYSTYLGGKGIDSANAIAVDAAGNAYVAGETSSDDLPIKNAPQQSLNDSEFLGDAFVAEVDAAGAALIFSTYLGGGASDAATGIAVDQAGGVYVTGYTASTNFPVVTPAQPRFGGGNLDGFVAKISSPKILSVSLSGKKLRVTGEGFAPGAVILINNLAQKTANDEASPTTLLVGKKAGKVIAPGQRVTIQVRNPDGSLSNEFSFLRPGN